MPIPERLNPTFVSGRAAEPDRMEEARKRLIVALDVQNAKAAEELVKRLEGECQWFKVGMELFTAAGPAAVEMLVARGHSVFLDLKFHDIPNTVAGAVRSAATLGVRMVNVHAGGGPAMLEAARAALEGMTNPPELLAVTVLTSMDAAQLKATGVRRSPAEQVELLARMCMKSGIRGFVCSRRRSSGGTSADRYGRRAGGSRHSARGRQGRRPEAPGDARRRARGWRKLSGGGKAHHASARPGRSG